MSDKIQTCDECRYDGGIHYSADGTQSWRPHLDELQTKQRAQAVVEAAHEQQVRDARRIIRDAAERHYEFSANTIRQELDDAGIDGPVVGAAFTWAQTQGVIEATGRSVMSSEASTRHRINVWASLVHPRVKREAP